MTIRDQLKSQMFKARIVAFGCWLLVAAGIVFPKIGVSQAWLIIPLIGFAGAVLYIVLMVKCPKCGARLGQTLSGMSKPNFCPTCGVDFDSRG